MSKNSSLVLSRQDSNLEFQNQNLTCYHYTTGQFIPTTLFYNLPRERDNLFVKKVWHLYLVRLCYNPFPTEREVNFPYISPVLLSFEKLRWAVSSPLKTILFSGNVTSTFTAFLLVSAVIYQVLITRTP